MATIYLPRLDVLGVRFYRWWDHRKNKAGQAAWAQEHGFRYIAASNEVSPNWSTSLLSVPWRRRDEHVIVGTSDGREFVSLEMVGEDTLPAVGSGRRVVRKHVVATRLPRRLPMLQMESETVLKKAQRIVHDERINFESEEFNKAWRVSCPLDPQFASMLVHPRFMEWALREDVQRWDFVLTGTDLIAIHGGRQSGEWIEAGMALLRDFVSLIPEQAWQDSGAEYAVTPFAVGI